MSLNARVASCLIAAASAALALGVGAASAATTDSSDSTQSADRVWYVVEINGRMLAGIAGTDGLVDEEYSDDDFVMPELPLDSVPDDDYARLRLLQSAGLADGASTYGQAMDDLELPFMFAGLEQWVRNLDGTGVESEPALWNVSMGNITTDEHAARMLLGRAVEAVEEEGRSLQADLSYWRSLVPDWAPRVRDQLAARGIPFSVELLAWPGFNLDDPARPLFGLNSAPTSLISLGVDQRGERDFLRSLSAEELMLQVWPLFYRFHHRSPGAPVPPEYRAGLTFGSPVQLADGSYLLSPVQESAVYKRWVRWGYPGLLPDSEITKLPSFSSVWFVGNYADYDPGQLDDATKERYLALMQGQ
jgi:hypothetical protein